jgi:hypothetical protein
MLFAASTTKDKIEKAMFEYSGDVKGAKTGGRLPNFAKKSDCVQGGSLARKTERPLNRADTEALTLGRPRAVQFEVGSSSGRRRLKHGSN